MDIMVEVIFILVLKGLGHDAHSSSEQDWKQ